MFRGQKSGEMEPRKAQLLKKALDAEVGHFKEAQKQLQKLLRPHQQYESQLTENTQVKEELARLEDEAVVYKLVGPVLVKQDLDEARGNVDKRLQYITGELERLKKQIETLEGKTMKHRGTIMDIQQQFQKAQQAAVKAQLAQQQQQSQ